MSSAIFIAVPSSRYNSEGMLSACQTTIQPARHLFIANPFAAWISFWPQHSGVCATFAFGGCMATAPLGQGSHMWPLTNRLLVRRLHLAITTIPASSGRPQCFA